jgi:hypothetical protein
MLLLRRRTGLGKEFNVTAFQAVFSCLTFFWSINDLLCCAHFSAAVTASFSVG